MLVNLDYHRCNKCQKIYSFRTDKPYSTNCPECGEKMEFYCNRNIDEEAVERVKCVPIYDPTKDPNSSYYIPVVRCPFCQSPNVHKIGTVSKVVSASLFGLGSNKIGKQWHCNKCGSNF